MAINEINEEKKPINEKVSSDQGGNNNHTIYQNKGAPRLLDILANNYSSNGPLSAEADGYLKKLREVLEDHSQPIKIQAKRLNSFQGAIAFTSESYGMVLIFEDENPQSVQEIVQSSLIKKAKESFMKDYGNYQLINIVCIDKYSYDRYLQMAEYIIKCFKIHKDDNVKNLTIDMFNKETYAIDIETNIGEVRSFMNNYSPRRVQPRMDFGFVCNISSGYKQSINGPVYTNRSKWFGVSAFVEFVPDSTDIFSGMNNFNQAIPKFTPLIRITDIISLIPSEIIIPLVLSLSAEIFCAYNTWQTPYRILKKGSPNIGQLIIDPKTNKPSNITEKDVNGFFNTFFNPPVLAIDLGSNFNFIPGLSYITLPGGLSNVFNSFLKTKVADNNPISTIFFSEIVGSAEIKGLSSDDVIDSKYLDYLNLCNLIGYNEKVAKLLYRYEDPYERATIIEDLVTDFKKSSMCYVSVLDSKFVSNISNAIAPYINLTSSISKAIPRINSSILKNNLFQGTPTLSGMGKSQFNHNPLIFP